MKTTLIFLLFLMGCSQEQHIEPKFHYQDRVKFQNHATFYGECHGFVYAYESDPKMYYVSVYMCNNNSIADKSVVKEENLTLIKDGI